MPFSFAQIKPKAHLEGKVPRTKGAMTAPIADLDPAFSVFVFGDQDGGAAVCGSAWDARGERGADAGALGRMAEQPTWKDALPLCDQQTLDLIASFQHAVVGDLMRKTFAAAEAWARPACW